MQCDDRERALSRLARGVIYAFRLDLLRNAATTLCAYAAARRQPAAAGATTPSPHGVPLLLSVKLAGRPLFPRFRTEYRLFQAVLRRESGQL